MKVCPACKKEIPAESIFCMFCGAEYIYIAPTNNESESIPWNKFYSYSDWTYVVKSMMEEGVKIVYDSTLTEDNLNYVLSDLERDIYRQKVLSDLSQTGYKLTSAVLMELLDCDDANTFQYAMTVFDGKMSAEEITEMAEYEIDPNILNELILRCNDTFSFDQIETIFDYGNLTKYSKIKLLSNANDTMTVSHLDTILYDDDKEIYPYLIPHIRKMSFEDRMEVKEEYDIKF